jgi:hypothetical protein
MDGEEGYRMQTLFSYVQALPKGQKWFLAGLGFVVVLPFTAMVGLQIYNSVNLAMLGRDIAAREAVWKSEARTLNAHVDPERDRKSVV